MKLNLENMGSVTICGNLKGSVISETNYVGDGKEEDNSRHNRNSDDNEKTVSTIGNAVAVGKLDGDISHKLNATVKREKINEWNNEENESNNEVNEWKQ